MRKKIIIWMFIGLNINLASLLEARPFLKISLPIINEIARRIKVGEAGRTVPLYEVAMFLHKWFGTGEFNLQQVIQEAKKERLGTFDQAHAYYRLELLVRVGVLEIERRGTPNPNIYRLKPPFVSPDNLKLLSCISELQRASYYSQQITPELVAAITGKIEIIKEAIAINTQGLLKVNLSPELGRDFPEIKMKFLIGIVGQKMVDLYRSFSEILIKKVPSRHLYRVDIDYVTNEVEITIPAYPMQYVYEETPLVKIMGMEPEKIEYDPMWSWLGNEHFRRELVHAVIQEDLRLEALLTPLESFFFGNLSLVYTLPPELIPQRLTILEKFITGRNEPRFKNLYNKFVSAAKKVLQIRSKPIEKLSLIEKKVLILRYGMDDPMNDEVGLPRSRKEVASILGISIEGVRQAEERAREKLRHTVDEREVAPYLAEVEMILKEVESKLREP